MKSNDKEDYSYYYSLLVQQTVDQMNDNNKTLATEEAGIEDEEKQGVKTKGLKEILTSLLLIEEQDKSEKQDYDQAQEQDRFMIEENHKKKTKVMLDYKNELQQLDHVLDQTHHVRKRKSRAATNAAVAAATAASVISPDSDNNQAIGPAGTGGPQRRLWVKTRSTDWWDKCNSPEFPEEEFKKAFRMGKDTFEMICNELTSVVAKENTMLRDAVPVRQRVAVCIWRLATGEPLRLVSRRFGLGISTCHKLVLEVCSAIKNVLMPKYLQWPDEESVRMIKEDFGSVSGIPNVIGSMYTTHIPIIAPKISVAAYFNKRHTERNQKTSYSITVQGVVDPRGVFTDVCIGWPGSMPDDQVLEKSALYQRANNGLLKDVWVVGSSGYPLMDWVLVPYTQPHLTWTQHAFNEKIGEIQRVAKDSFARLKGRWSCLQKRTEVKLQDLPVVLGACCVLHNICEMRNEEIEPELMIQLMDDEMVPEIGLRSTIAMKKRDSIAHNLLHHNHAGTSFLS